MRCLTVLIASLGASLAVASVAPAFADDGWRHHEQDWRQHEWREHERREHEWREHEWRERYGYYAPRPIVVPPPFSYFGPPPVYYGAPRY
jgi:hypothetical protein